MPHQTFTFIKIHPERIKKGNKNIIEDLHYEGIEFPVPRKFLGKIEKKNNVWVNVFCYENNLLYFVHISDQKFKDCIDLSMITNQNKSYYVYIKDFNRFMCNKTKSKIKRHCCRYCLQYFSSEKVLAEHRKLCLKNKSSEDCKIKKWFN